MWIHEDEFGHREEVTYVDGVREGSFRELLPGGVPHREGEYRRGKLHGTLITRDSSGRVLDRSPFVHGTGVYRIFTSDGSLGWEIPLRDGERHGMLRRRRGGKWSEEEWCDGVRIPADGASDPKIEQPRWEVLDVDRRSGRVAARLTFVAGTSYCCYEWGCHVPLFSKEDWQRVRSRVLEHGGSAPDPMALHLEVVVEPGAAFHGHSDCCGEVSEGLTYEEIRYEEPS